jgi:chemotaxis family two-component system response regulator Rcp1
VAHLNTVCESGSNLLKQPVSVELLLVEDNAGDAQLIKEIISRCCVAVRITVAEDGEKALALLADPQFKPDLIITDMNMPKVAGPELLERCNANGIPVVVFSSSRNPTDRAEALRLGAREYVEKPTDLDEYTNALWKMIWKWIQPPGLDL